MIRESTTWPFYGSDDNGTIYSRRSGKWTAIKPYLNSCGYLCVNVCFGGGKPRKTLAHQLVCDAFMGPRPAGLVTRHLDGNKVNNHPSNLRWGTEKENKADAFRHGTVALGAKTNRAKLTEDEVRGIRAKRAAGGSLRSIAKKMSMAYSSIRSVVNRNTYSHIN